MKRIRCPKCDESIQFEETQYAKGSILVFECPNCHKQFKIRIPKATGTQKSIEKTEKQPIGILTVLENAFQFKQEIPLYEGDNVIGRLVQGQKNNAAIKTVDPSIDTTHCIIHANYFPNGKTRFVIRDAPSNTGTFVQNVILKDQDRTIISEGTIINIGAATLILHSLENENV